VKLLVTVAFTFTFLVVIVVLDLKKNIGGLSDLVKKAQISGFAYPYSPPSSKCMTQKSLGNELP